MNYKRALLITKLPTKIPSVFKTCRLVFLATRVISKRNLGINPAEGHKQNREKVWVTDRIRIWKYYPETSCGVQKKNSNPEDMRFLRRPKHIKIHICR